MCYIVSRTWVNQALANKSDEKSTDAESANVSLGPIDNSDIIHQVIKQPDGTTFTQLTPGAGLESFELFPEDAWKLVVDWYGIAKAQEPITRTAINTAIDHLSDSNVLYEFHPPVFRVHRVWSQVSPFPIEQSLKSENPSPLLVAASAKTRAQEFLKQVKTAVGIPIDRKVRIFEIPQQIPAATQKSKPKPKQSAALTPPESPGRQSTTPGMWQHLLVDVEAFAASRNIRIPAELPDHTFNPNYNGKSALQIYNLVTDRTLILDESIGKFWVSTYTGQALKSNKNKGRDSALSSKPSSARSSPAPDAVVTRGRAQKQKIGRSLGAVGLHNLGNTCYMNSALQCVRSVEELTKFFITDAYKNEINKTNVLGYNGRVAMAYGGLLKEIYNEGRGSVSPREFKNTVGRCRSTFSGYGQQDSQEFLGFLLDGLQEDLSRVKKKPYIEKPDSTDDMINNPEAIREMAEKVWDITRKRDDSVIADLFTGMYKSTLKCPECGKISITFDPFNNLTLPLPMETVWGSKVKFFPLNDVPVELDVELPKHSSMDALKQYVSIRTGVPMERLMGAEEFKDTFFRIYDSTQDVSDVIGARDIPTIHELEHVPTNFPGKTPKKVYRSMLDIDTPLETNGDWDTTQYDRMVIPVFHRRPDAVGRDDGASPPHFITLTKEEAKDYDCIVRKVLERVSTFTTWEKLASHRQTSGSDSIDGDMVITSTSDADSGGDSKVAANSVDGEDDMVDISMKDASNVNSASPVAPIMQPKKLKSFNTRRPAFINRDEFLEPELQNMFELSYFSNRSDGIVPTGWNAVDGSRSLPKVVDRMVKEVKSEHDGQEENENDDAEDGEGSSTDAKSSGSGNGDSSNEDDGKDEVRNEHTRMVDESSDEEMSSASAMETRHARFGQKNAGGRKALKAYKTYGKKGNKRRDKHMRGNKEAGNQPSVRPQPVPTPVADGGPLIRLYEGLVVDWNEDAWQQVFGQVNKKQDSARGSRTFVDLELLNDPALKIRQRRRQTRRTKGITLDECLDEFERAEVLSEQDMWYCPRCKEHRRASKKFDLWKTPDYLVAHLKRFSSSGWRRDKLDVLVDFPIEGLDLTSRVIQKEDGKAEVYELIAVDDHYGGLGGGHYTAYAKNFVDGQWYNYNDSSVSLVSDPNSVVTSAAYLLFYRRRSKGHLGGERFAEILDKYDKSADEDEGSSEQKSDTSDSDSKLGRTSKGNSRRLGLVEDSDDELPSYSARPAHGSIANGGETGVTSMAQPWSFDGLGGDGAGVGDEDDSDQAQYNSSDNEGVHNRDKDADDTEMASTEDAQGVVGVDGGDNGQGGDDDEVAEIHVEDDRT